jgi:hypothetical protein
VPDPAPSEEVEDTSEKSAPDSATASVVTAFAELLGVILWAAIKAWLIAVVFVLLRDLVLAPLGAIGLLLAIQFALGSWVEWILLGALVVYSVWAVRAGGYWRQWFPWIKPGETWISPLLDAYRSLFVLTASFAGLTATLAAQGWLGVSPPIEGEGSVWSALAYYVWHFLDAIPVLEIPATLNWELATTYTGYTSGALLLVYKLLVIVPVVRAIVELVQRRQRTTPTPPGSPSVAANGSP